MLKVNIRVYRDPALSHLLDQREITGRRGWTGRYGGLKLRKVAQPASCKPWFVNRIIRARGRTNTWDNCRIRLGCHAG